MNYSDKLRDPRWQKKRLTILNRDKWQCQHCGASNNTLHVHHEQYNGEPWNAPDDKLKTLCASCHKKEEDLKRIPSLENMESERQLFISRINDINTLPNVKAIARQGLALVEQVIFKHYGKTY